MATVLVENLLTPALVIDDLDLHTGDPIEHGGFTSPATLAYNVLETGTVADLTLTLERSDDGDTWAAVSAVGTAGVITVTAAGTGTRHQADVVVDGVHPFLRLTAITATASVGNTWTVTAATLTHCRYLTRGFTGVVVNEDLQVYDGTTLRWSVDHETGLVAATAAGSYPDPVTGLLQMPRAGKLATQINQGTPGVKAALYLGTGNAGVVRHVWFTLGQILSVWKAPLSLVVFVDDGDITDSLPANATASNCALRVRLDSLMGCAIHTPGAERCWDNRWMGAGIDTVQNQSCFFLSLPMPYRDGIMIGVYNEDTAAWMDIAYSWVSYQDVLPTTSAHRDWTLCGKTVEGTYHDADDGFTLLAGTDTDSFAPDHSGNAGALISVHAAEDGLGWSFVENNWSAKFDGDALPSWQTSGTEDLYGTSAYMFSFGEFVGDQYAVHKADDGDTFYEAYRFFETDGFTWDESCNLYKPNTDGWEGDVNYVVSALYYADWKP